MESLQPQTRLSKNEQFHRSPTVKRPVGKRMKNYRRKITAQDAATIRQLIAERDRHLQEARKLTIGAIAEKFGISIPAVEAIQSGKSWKQSRPL